MLLYNKMNINNINQNTKNYLFSNEYIKSFEEKYIEHLKDNNDRKELLIKLQIDNVDYDKLEPHELVEQYIKGDFYIKPFTRNDNTKNPNVPFKNNTEKKEIIIQT